MSSVMEDSDNGVFYFCYGSNLLSKRIHISNKSAVKYSNGLLKGYRLTFSKYSNTWKGATANIVPEANCSVYGVIWKLSESDIPKLDKQEFGYHHVFVDVLTIDLGNNEIVKCRTYVQNDDTAITSSVNSEALTRESHVKDCDTHLCRVPSAAYKRVIINGAKEHNLPEEYIMNVIEAHPDNQIMECPFPELL